MRCDVMLCCGGDEWKFRRKAQTHTQQQRQINGGRESVSFLNACAPNIYLLTYSRLFIAHSYRRRRCR